ncbi:MAG: hypothetical protein HKO59_07320 [Phycisphaerales bacterium]|nr:hypothetical protein [Phycisphaerae bacterium]NNM25785.1 hypothetical protein [Phycisphaerales bacterium]
MSDARTHRTVRPVPWPLRLFSSIWLGVCLLALLFLYSSLGSAGLLYFEDGALFNDQLRQWRGLEMTEFEWFHWWPFDLLIGLICLNIVVATLRRIPFKPINFGVWMIHLGILLLCVGSVIYFGTKVEGDSPVARRQIAVSVDGGAPVRMTAMPGNRMVAGPPERPYGIEVASIDPNWELLSGADEGKRAYSVTLTVQTPERMFLRQVIAGYPDYTEDLVRGAEGEQPFVRAKKSLGTAIVDDAIQIDLEYEPQRYLYLANNLRKSWALYVREQGETAWTQRPLTGVPLYNDYIVSREDVWMPEGGEPLTPDPLDVRVPPAEPGDPLAGTDLRITSYLRHAGLETRRLPGGDTLDPALTVRLGNDRGQSKTYELVAFDPARNAEEGGRLQFAWVNSVEERDALTRFRERSLTITVPGTDVEQTVPIRTTARSNPELEFTALEGTPYAYRVEAFQDQLEIRGRLFSLAMVEIRDGERSFLRWVFDDPTIARDHEVTADGSGHQHVLPLDEGIVMTYDPGHRAAPVLVVAGPEPETLGLQLTLPGQDPVYRPIQRGVREPIDQGISMVVERYTAFSRTQTRPAIVPSAQRDRDAREFFAMVKVEVPTGAGTTAAWVPFHHYPVESPNGTLRRFTYRPTSVELADGRTIELIFSRQRRPLPTPVVLEDFQVASHIGGFTGRTSSIRDWTSIVRFGDADGQWTDPMAVSVNQPAEHEGYWYFQAQWDPPMGARFEGDRPSAGLNYTVLGVGNRNGVVTQLLGCVIAVIGMIYAFYVKPILKRRRRRAVEAALAVGVTADGAAENTAESPEPLMPVGAEEAR